MNNTFEVIKSKDGYSIINVNINGKNVNIGSKYNEQREIDKFIRQIGNLNKKDIYIVLGLGYGNHVEELMRIKDSDSKVLILECNKEVIKHFKEKKAYNENQICITESIDDVHDFVVKNVNNGNVNFLKILAYGGYEKHYANELVPLYKVVKDLSFRIKVNNNTYNRFQNMWYSAKIENLKFMANAESICKYKDIYKGESAIIVSAGPSLSKNVSLLSENKSSVIIAGGRTLKPIIESGVDPDYTVVIDPGEIVHTMVDGYIEKTQSTLVHHLGVNSQVVANHKGNKIIVSDKEVVESLLDEPSMNVSGGGSVAHAMTNLAIYMGCNPIIFIGQDFAYTDDNEHAKEAVVEKLKTIDEKNFKLDSDLIVEDINSKPVRTSKILNLYRKQLEEIIRINNSVKFINATEGGANIEGTEVGTLEQIINKYTKVDNKKLKKAIHNKEIEKKVMDMQCLNYKAMKLTINLYEKALGLLSEYKKASKLGFKNKNMIDEKIRKIEKEILKNNKNILFVNDMCYRLVYALNNGVGFLINDSDSERTREIKIIKKNEFIYKYMIENLKQNIKLVEKEINTNESIIERGEY